MSNNKKSFSQQNNDDFPLQNDFYLQLITYENLLNQSNFSSEIVSKAIQLFGKCVEFYDMIGDPIKTYFMEKIQNALTNQRTQELKVSRINLMNNDNFNNKNRSRNNSFVKDHLSEDEIDKVEDLRPELKKQFLNKREKRPLTMSVNRMKRQKEITMMAKVMEITNNQKEEITKGALNLFEDREIQDKQNEQLKNKELEDQNLLLQQKIMSRKMKKQNTVKIGGFQERQLDDQIRNKTQTVQISMSEEINKNNNFANNFADFKFGRSESTTELNGYLKTQESDQFYKNQNETFDQNFNNKKIIIKNDQFNDIVDDSDQQINMSENENEENYNNFLEEEDDIIQKLQQRIDKFNTKIIQQNE